VRCPTDKAGWDRYADAEVVAVARGLRIYRCPDCRRWHLTSKRITPGGVEKMRVAKAVAELRRKGITGPLRDQAEARAAELGCGEFFVVPKRPA
jgi:hypothetical protein